LIQKKHLILQIPRYYQTNSTIVEFVVWL